jgi:hypothetical protein
MTLQASGAISFSDIATEFNDTGELNMSGYYAANGQGVTEIPASGAISFSDFYSVDNVVDVTGVLSRYYDLYWWWNHQDTYISCPLSDLWCPTCADYGEKGRLVGFIDFQTGTPSDSALLTYTTQVPNELTASYTNVTKNDVTGGDIRFSYDTTTTVTIES